MCEIARNNEFNERLEIANKEAIKHIEALNAAMKEDAKWEERFANNSKYIDMICQILRSYKNVAEEKFPEELKNVWHHIGSFVSVVERYAEKNYISAYKENEYNVVYIKCKGMYIKVFWNFVIQHGVYYGVDEVTENEIKGEIIPYENILQNIDMPNKHLKEAKINAIVASIDEAIDINIAANIILNIVKKRLNK